MEVAGTASAGAGLAGVGSAGRGGAGGGGRMGAAIGCVDIVVSSGLAETPPWAFYSINGGV